ncbi:hypothetical protein GGX14DRAFT_407955 [Mycena pura]|uniref:Uncharacterized protein n=1 Tax=Mycena pura TaxID=153505 RepID=A0AAD6Y1T1_9AGAR|nr:hypothetical protein GGX14DRAFT_407955 [Mycena pura]
MCLLFRIGNTSNARLRRINSVTSYHRKVPLLLPLPHFYFYNFCTYSPRKKFPEYFDRLPAVIRGDPQHHTSTTRSCRHLSKNVMAELGWVRIYFIVSYFWPEPRTFHLARCDSLVAAQAEVHEHRHGILVAPYVRARAGAQEDGNAAGAAQCAARAAVPADRLWDVRSRAGASHTHAGPGAALRAVSGEYLERSSSAASSAAVYAWGAATGGRGYIESGMTK